VQEYISKEEMMERVTIPTLHEMKRNGRKIVAVVGWDFQIARIADRAGVDIISVGDSVGINLWGRDNEQDVTIDEMVLVCRAVRSGTSRALVSCDFPYGPFQRGIDSAVAAASRLVNEGGADMVKMDGAADSPETVAAIVGAGIPVFAQFGNRVAGSDATEKLVVDAKRLEAAGASLIDFIHSGAIAGPAVVNAVSIPVIGGLGGGPWLDGRLRRVDAAIGYVASTLDAHTDNYANVARIALSALTAYAEDVRAGRQIK
jgi:3-methyl-2-oxobutanoate hydroxymethyltransferase